jgi:hypothetical protein
VAARERTSAGDNAGRRHLRPAVAVIAATVLVASILTLAGRAGADLFSNFLQPEQPGHLTLTVFGAGFGSESYGATHGGFELEQSLTRGIGLVARFSAYQSYMGTGYDTPITPATNGPFFWGRFEGGIDLTPVDGTHLTFVGGNDVGDSHSAVIEGNFSSWMNIHNAHPVNLSISSSHYFENDLINGLIDVRVIALSTAKLMLLAGAGAIIWGNGNTPGVQVQGGPDMGFYFRDWKLRVDVQGGYGFDNEYGLVAVSRSFDWVE